MIWCTQQSLSYTLFVTFINSNIHRMYRDLAFMWCSSVIDIRRKYCDQMLVQSNLNYPSLNYPILNHPDFGAKQKVQVKV